METALAKRRVALQFPAALLPALAALAALTSTVSGAGGLAALQLLRAHLRRVGALSRKVSRELSRSLSGRLFSPKGGSFRVLGPRGALGGSLALLLFGALRHFWSAVSSSLSLMSPPEKRLDPHLAEQRQAVISLPDWGHGLPRPPQPGEWRPYLHGLKDARENLEEIHGVLGVTGRLPEELTLDQLAEGVRRVLVQKHTGLLTVTRRYWSREQAQGIAEALAVECGLQMPLPRGHMEEVVPAHLYHHIPWTAPWWLQLSQRLGIATLRPIFLHVFGWTSRCVQTPYGPMHVYDAHPQASSEQAGSEAPPLLLQHGLFVTGWSMALLAWLLCRRGRRVIVPDLFDFDHSLSISESARAGGEKVRRPVYMVEALLCVVRDLLDGGAREFDICGHSYGGFLVSALAVRCQREALPLRKVVLLGPGGPFMFLYHNPMLTRFLLNPMETVDDCVPQQIAASAVKAAARCGLGVLLSPNNANHMFGLPYQDYLGDGRIGSDCPTLLIWGDSDAIVCPRKPHCLERFLRSRFPRLEGYFVRGGGHNIHLFSAVAVGRAVDVWLQGGAGGDEGLLERMLFPLDPPLDRMDLACPGSHASDIVMPLAAAARPLTGATHSRL